MLSLAVFLTIGCIVGLYFFGTGDVVILSCVLRLSGLYARARVWFIISSRREALAWMIRSPTSITGAVLEYFGWAI